LGHQRGEGEGEDQKAHCLHYAARSRRQSVTPMIRFVTIVVSEWLMTAQYVKGP